VVIYPDENDTRLKSGMNVSVEFIAQQAENVLVVPIKAVFPYENSPHVTLKD
jgi:multidrug efflux pump subunit AcrA (membrane-fusion protein)